MKRAHFKEQQALNEELFFMRCPTLSELSPPLSGKTGWPWTDETPQAGDTLLSDQPWPRISIVTPNYNYGRFLEETIRSVLLQGYPNLEYIVIDGGSTDNSVEIIKKYEKWITYWVSEQDGGQSQAINKGWKMATGDILAYLCSDDLYEQHAFQRIGKLFVKNSNCNVCFGHCLLIDEPGHIRGFYEGKEQSFIQRLQYWKGWNIPQPTVFLRHHVLKKIDLLNESLNYGMDYDLLIRVCDKFKLHHLDYVLARYRIHSASKTGSWAKAEHLFYQDCHFASRKHWGSINNIRFWCLLISYLKYKMRILLKRFRNIFYRIKKRFYN